MIQLYVCLTLSNFGFQDADAKIKNLEKKENDLLELEGKLSARERVSIFS